MFSGGKTDKEEDVKRKKFIRFLAILLCLVMLGGGGVQATEKMDEIQTEEITGNDPETGTAGETEFEPAGKTETEADSGIAGTGKTESGSAGNAEAERNGGTETEAGGHSESDRGSGSDLESDAAGTADQENGTQSERDTDLVSGAKTVTDSEAESKMNTESENGTEPETNAEPDEEPAGEPEPIVNVLGAGPLVGPVIGSLLRKQANGAKNLQSAGNGSENGLTAAGADGSGDTQEDGMGSDTGSGDGLELSKSAVYREDGTVGITLEAYTTGNVTVEQGYTPADIVLVLDQSGSMADPFGQGENSQVKLAALKAAVKTFCDSVKKDAVDHDVEYRIAMVGFASERSYENGINTEIFTGSNPSNPTNYYSATDAAYKDTLQDMRTQSGKVDQFIDALDAEGGTHTDLGMEMAKKIFEKNPVAAGERRNRIVIVFTDGKPGDQGFSRRIADSAISKAYDIKQDYGATVYTIGIFDGANAALPTGQYNDWDWESTKANRFMHYLSTNYPQARSMTQGGAQNSVSTKYYQSVADAGKLSEAFQNIFEQTKVDTLELRADTQVRDMLSDVLTFPTGGSGAAVYRVPCTAVSEDGTVSWAARAAWEDITASMTLSEDSENGTLTVSGYDFKENYVAKLEDGSVHGAKLVIEFSAVPAAGFIGGNQVETNRQEASGIYKDDDQVKAFPLPHVDILLQYEFTPQDAAVYLGDQTEGAAETLFAGGLQYQIGGSTYTPDGIRNAYVDLVFTVTDADGTVAGIYTVPAGKKTGTWKGTAVTEDGVIDTTGFHEDQNYQVCVSVIPVLAGSQSTLVSDAKPETIHVFRPAVNVSDSVIFLGEKTDLSERIGSVSWNCDCTGEALAAASGLLKKEAPELELTCEPVNGTSVTDTEVYAPETDSDFKIRVKKDGTDITADTVIQKQVIAHTADCIQNGTAGTGGSEADHDFTVHVIGGTITLTKKLTAPAARDAVFTFKIEYSGAHGTETYYRSVRIKAGETERTALPLTGLPKGTYEVTELSALQFQLAGTELAEGNDCAAATTEAGVQFRIGTPTGRGQQAGGLLRNGTLLGQQAGTLVQTGRGAHGAAVFRNRWNGTTAQTKVDVMRNSFSFRNGTSADDLK